MNDHASTRHQSSGYGTLAWNLFMGVNDDMSRDQEADKIG